MAISNVYITPSSYMAYCSCPLRYYAEYVIRTPRARQSKNPNFVYGTSVHSALAQFIKIGGWKKHTVDDLISLLMRKWDERAFASPEESYFYFDKARDCLEAFYHSPYPNIDEVEKEVFTEGFLTWEKPRNGFIAKGKLDRVVLRKDNILEVIDYKTGTSLSTTEQLKASAQSLFYRTVISDCARRYSVGEVVLTYYYLETNSLVRLSYDKEEFYELWSSLSNKTKAIVSLHSLKMAWTDIEKEIAANPGSHCQYCPISATCQANRETQVLNSTRAA